MRFLCINKLWAQYKLICQITNRLSKCTDHLIILLTDRYILASYVITAEYLHILFIVRLIIIAS